MLKVDCNECGASLVVADATRFVTCKGCSSRLKVVRSEAAVYTERLTDDVHTLKKELDQLEEAASSSPSSAQVPGASESLLRIAVGGIVIASDLYWWITDPSLQQFYVRVLLIIAGAWLILTGIWKLATTARHRNRVEAATQAVIARQRGELERSIEASEESKR